MDFVLYFHPSYLGLNKFLTDPLTVRELVEKSYEYIDRLGRECTKTLLSEFNMSHKKFDVKNYPAEVGASIVQWFAKRDKNLKISLESSSIEEQQPTVGHLKLKGSTKDADFTISGTVSGFLVPQSGGGEPLCFVKTLTISAERANFTRRR